MRESSWDDCLNSNVARKVSPDIKRADSLIETAKERVDAITDVNKKNCNFVFEDYYTSLLELLQAIAFRKGYNVLNHLCLGYYLKDTLKRGDLYLIFDDLRYKRNSLTYYGNRMEEKTAKESIEKCKKIIKEIEKYLK
ncbi:MAG: hypothetical protein KAT77_00760 [Nanoarchaeota archaeon]|nr:hypothetical protein [Nanoarchaeota archaeon]